MDPVDRGPTQPDCPPHRRLEVHARHRDRRASPGAVGDPLGGQRRRMRPTSRRWPRSRRDPRAACDRLARTIAGATTIKLTEDQVDSWPRSRARCGSWAGRRPIRCRGVPAFNDQFASARCAAGSTTSTATTSSGSPSRPAVDHVFCFAYYVTPPPTSGTIIVRKRLRSRPSADVPADVPLHGQHLLHARPDGPSDPQKNYFDVTGGVSDADPRRPGDLPARGGVRHGRSARRRLRRPGHVRGRAVHARRRQLGDQGQPSARGVRPARRRRRRHVHIHRTSDVPPGARTCGRSPPAGSARFDFAAQVGSADA